MYVKYERGFLYKYKLFTYEDEDLTTSVTLGRRCEEFIKKETQTFGVDGEDEDDTKPHAINICKQVAAVSGNTCDIKIIFIYTHERIPTLSCY